MAAGLAQLAPPPAAAPRPPREVRLVAINRSWRSALSSPDAMMEFLPSGPPGVQRVTRLEGGGPSLCLSRTMMRGSFSTVAVCATEYGQLFALRTLLVSSTPCSRPGQIARSRPRDVMDEITAMVAARSPLVPLDHFASSQTLLHFLLPLATCDLSDLSLHIPSMRGDPAGRSILAELGLTLAYDLFSRLAVLHAAGYVHNDIKPNNVLLFADDPKDCDLFVLADFGLARPYDGSYEPSSQELGTHTYAPPERLLSATTPLPSQYDPRSSDVFSAALTVLDVCGAEAHGQQRAARQAGWHKRNAGPAMQRFVAEADAWLVAGRPAAGGLTETAGGRLGHRVQRFAGGQLLDLLGDALTKTWLERPSAHQLAHRAEAFLATALGQAEAGCFGLAELSRGRLRERLKHCLRLPADSPRVLAESEVRLALQRPLAPPSLSCRPAAA